MSGSDGNSLDDQTVLVLPINICATRLMAQVLSEATTAKSPGKSLKLFGGGASLACLLCQRTLSVLPETVLSVEGGVDCRGVGDGTRGVGLPLATAQSVENVLGSPVLAFREPLAYLAYDRPGTPFASSLLTSSSLRIGKLMPCK